MPSIARIRAKIAKEGEPITLRRFIGSPPSQTTEEVEVIGFVRRYDPEELVAQIQQGDREIIIGNKEIAAESWPGPPRKGDRAVIGSQETTVQSAETRKFRGEVAMIIIHVRG